MKVYLLYRDQDFDFEAGLPPGHEDLIQDLELNTLLRGDGRRRQVPARGVHARCCSPACDDPEAIRYRQQVLADCLAQPGGHPRDVRGRGRRPGGQAAPLGRLRRQLPEPLVQPLGRGQPPGRLCGPPQAAAEDRRRPRREFRSDGMRALFATLQRELDDEYFEEISDHLKQLRFRAGVLISAELGRDNSGIGFVLRAPGDAPAAVDRAAGDRPAHLLLLHPRAPRRGRRPDPGGPHQPGHQPGRQRGRPVRGPHRQLLHHAASRAGLLRRLPQPGRPAGRQGSPGVGPRAGSPSSARVLVHRPARRLPGVAVTRARWSATTCRPTGSRWSSSPAPTREGNRRSCAASEWPSS